MKDHAARPPADDYHIVKASWPVLDERNRWPTPREQLLYSRRIALDCRGREPAPLESADHLAAPDSSRLRVDQVGEGFRVDGARPPIPHHHRDRRAAAQRFRLRQVWNVEHQRGRRNGLGVKRRSAYRRGKRRSGRQNETAEC